MGGSLPTEDWRAAAVSPPLSQEMQDDDVTTPLERPFTPYTREEQAQ